MFDCFDVQHLPETMIQLAATVLAGLAGTALQYSQSRFFVGVSALFGYATSSPQR
jgi:hypothetical protein